MPSVPQPEVVLKPLSRPELGDIQVEDAVFAIGRGEQPFASYGNSVVNMLSRRHARIFRKDGSVYLADLESLNGTSVNHVGVGHAPCELRDGDEICFADVLSYRVQITPHTRPEGIMTLTLTPDSAESGLAPIVITKFPFLVSKTEATFSHYKSDSKHARELGYLSRRHAYIYQKDDQAYIEDLESGNGTFIDGMRLERAVPLQDGVLVGFGGKHFVYRVGLTGESGVEPANRTALKTLAESRPLVAAKPVAASEPVVDSKSAVESKPVVASRANVPQASVSVMPGPAAELANSAASLPEGNRVVQSEPSVSRASVTRIPEPGTNVADSGVRKPAPESRPIAESKPAPESKPIAESKPTPESKPVAQSSPNKQTSASPTPDPAVVPTNSDPPKPPVQRQPNTPPALGVGKTQFMAAPTSFLEILCDPVEPKAEHASGSAAAPAPAAKEPPVSRRPRNRALLLLSELASLHGGGGEPESAWRRWWIPAAVAGVLAAVILAVYFWNAPERDLKNAVAHGEYARAALLAGRLLDEHPDDIELEAWATDASLKANVPAWLVKVRARDFDGATGIITGMAELGRHDAHLRPMIAELEWLGTLARVVSGRGGPEAPIRIYADEYSIDRLVTRWNDDTDEHQRVLARIASHVPQFGDWYGTALTWLRKLQSESTVYLPVIERLKTNIATDLDRDNPDALKPVLKEAADKYPGLGGLDAVRQDLASYIEIRREVDARKSGRLFALLHQARFVTPPFQQSMRELIVSGRVPPADLLQQYDAATQIWKDGNTSEAQAGLQKMATGPWSEDVAKELERRRRVTARFAELQQSRSAADYVDRLLSFRESLDAAEDVYFVRATAEDLNQQKGTVIARAQDAMNQARMFWEEYRSNGAIDASQRIETSISDQFRHCAHLLAEASRSVQAGFLLYSQVDPAGAAQWSGIRAEIESEVTQQRSRLNDLSNVVEPELLKTKLALLGDANE